jgi:aspartate kinase
MAFLVQKYGGTSVGNPERISAVAARVAEHVRAGDKIVVVVSAMSGVTDNLIKLARAVATEPDTREMDMLLATGEQQTIALTAMALHGQGVKAVSLTGGMAGIVTDRLHTKAKISNISPKKVFEYLDSGHVVIVAGFQGQNDDGHITTLGRGGSDLTAIALAAALKADRCEIYTDVDGVYTADPRVVKTAKKIDEISYDEMLELASLGAKVMQARSVEFAKKFKVEFVVRSSFNKNQGTLVREEHAKMEDVVLRGVSLDKNQAKVTILGVPDKPGVAAGIFSALAAAGTNVDMIVQNVSAQGTTDLTFTINQDDLPAARKVIEAQAGEIGAKSHTAKGGISKLSVVGIGMRSHTGVAAALFQALAQAGINIQMISTSEIKISVIIDEAEGARATQVVHDAFKLGAA